MNPTTLRLYRWLGLIAFAVAVIVVALIFLSRANRASAKNPPTDSAQARAAKPKPVGVIKPIRRDIDRTLIQPGDIQAYQQATLYAKVAGYLKWIGVDKGDRVKAGQLLAVIEAPELEKEQAQLSESYQGAVAAYRGSQAGLKKALQEADQASAGLAKARVETRQAEVRSRQAITKQAQAKAELEKAIEQKHQAEATYAQIQEEINQAKAGLEEAKAQYELASAEARRLQEVFEKDNGLIARQDLEMAETKAAVAKNRIDAAQSQIAAA